MFDNITEETIISLQENITQTINNIMPFIGIQDIDIRPVVSTYDPDSATKSAFEFDSRVYTGTGQTPPYVLSDDEPLNLTYTYPNCP